MRRLSPLTILFLFATALPAPAQDSVVGSDTVALPQGGVVVPAFGEEITVVGDAPFIYPVELGRPVVIRFGIGEIDIEANGGTVIRADLDVECTEKLTAAQCEKYRRRLRLEPIESDEGVEVRLVGLSKWKLRKLRLNGRVEVPRWSPLTVRIGIGDVDIRSDNQDLTVQMGIGDLTVHVPESNVGTVRVATRIGDASVRGPKKTFEGGRRMLIGARLSWDGGPGDAHINVGLKIGDAKVVLE